MKKEDLKVGDTIRLLHVPPFDLEQRDALAGEQDFIMMPTATVLEYVLANDPIVTIDEVDEYHQPWFSVVIQSDGEEEHHTIAIMDDKSWELVT